MPATASNCPARMKAKTLLLIIAASVVTINFPSAKAFAPQSSSLTTSTSRIQQQDQQQLTQQQQQRKLSYSALQSNTNDETPEQTSTKTLVLISPPGGLGEITAVAAAMLGTSVRWFIVSPPSTSSSPPSQTLSSASLSAIEGNGGSVALAGAQADTLLLPKNDADSAVPAVKAWYDATAPAVGEGVELKEGVICIIDGIEEAVKADVAFKEYKDGEAAKEAMMDAIKVATREACAAVNTGVKVALVPSDMDIFLDMEEECEVPMDDDDAKDAANNDLEEVSKLLAFVTNPFTKKEASVPTNIFKAMGGGCVSPSKLTTLRYGELFGLPESSTVNSPFIGGPRRDPVIRDEYTMRAIRIDPTLSLSGNSMLSEAYRPSRLSLASAAARMALSLTPTLPSNLDICLTSLRGLELPTVEDWDEEFERVEEIMQETGGSGAQLFAASFGSVPNVERLADWLASKWAPTVLRTYDIAGIRVGARPVFASKVGDRTVEIEWQVLRDFETFVVGKMTIEVDEKGITAVRGAGDASSGYGSVSRKPLNGEDILVRRLSDAVTQAVEKGLATKPKAKKKPKKIEVVEKPIINTMVSSGTVAAETTPAADAPVAASETGPRSAGTRRSAKRKRGTRKEVGTEPPKKDSSSTPSPPVPPVDESQTGSWQ